MSAAPPSPSDAFPPPALSNTPATPEPAPLRQLDFWFDPVSPYAALAFAALPEALEGLSVTVRYRPVLFAGLLRHWGQLGPAEMVPKREWTYRQVLWEARRRGLPLQLPSAHPFNPLALLRLALACASPAGQALAAPQPEEDPLRAEPSDAHDAATAPLATPNRRVVQSIFDHVWQGGGDPLDSDRLAALTERLAPARDPGGDAVRAALRTSTEAAVAAGVFGVPTVRFGSHNFWGLDALPMLAECLRGDAWFDGPEWTGVGALPVGVVRPR